ncbi:MAG: helix-hairpin-helix domain-containing protein [Roseburia sp.]
MKWQKGARVCDVLELAGGLKDAAAKEALNQAEPVVDGQMIKVPDQETYLLQQTGSADSAAEPEDGRINLNTASKEQLMTLSGIGESKAETIISYREKNGAFQTIEDLMNIPGIKNGVFEKIKDNIRVN